MKVPLNWLKEYVEIDISTDDLVAKLTAIGHMQDKKPEQIGDDIVLDLEVRQNRSDCLSMLGIAREVAAVTGKTIKEPTLQAVAAPLEMNPPNKDNQTRSVINENPALSIENREPTLCRRFKAMRIRLGTQHSTLNTPLWIKQKLSAYGIKTISPLVDITNFVMIEYGEPMHAFDAQKVKDGHVIIRRATDKEKLVILGGRELALTPDDLVIADSEKILSFSGLIGGEESGVNEHTTDVILEAATYHQAVIRRSSLRHAVRTEASTRHEKFLHPTLAEIALNRAAHLILEICGGNVMAISDSYPHPEVSPDITLRLSEVERLGGISIPLIQIKQYLKSLSFPILSAQNSEICTCPPYWRTDIEQEADLIEEVLRVHGYEHIPAELPSFPPPKNITSYWVAIEDRIREIMLQFGFDEQITEPLTKYHAGDKVQSAEKEQIKLQNALNTDKNALRTSLKEGLLYAVNHQKKFGREAIKVFELGKVYFKNQSPQPYTEIRHFGFIMHNAHGNEEDIYFHAKGIAEAVCTHIEYAYHKDAVTLEFIDPFTVYCSIALEELQKEKISVAHKLYTSIPHMQRFDVSFVVSSDNRVGDILNLLHENHPELDDIKLREKPRKMANGQQSILLQFILISHTISKDDVASSIARFLTDKYGATIR